MLSTNGQRLVAVAVVIVIILALVYWCWQPATVDYIPGFWSVPPTFLSKMGLAADSRANTQLSVSFTRDKMYVMIYMYGYVTVQRYRCGKALNIINIAFETSTSEVPAKVKIDPLFDDGAYEINMADRTLLIHDQKRLILQLIRQ